MEGVLSSCLGEASQRRHFPPQVMGALLYGASDAAEPAVRTSCLGCLATVAATLRLALHPWAVRPRSRSNFYLSQVDL